MGALRDAYWKWVTARREAGEHCCYRLHADLFGSQTDQFPDSQVCPRERAWREYVRLRDGNLQWPFVETGDGKIGDPRKPPTPEVEAKSTESLRNVIELSRAKAAKKE